MSQALESTFCTRSQSMAKLLGQHYGDRSIYMESARDRALFKDAEFLGLVTTHGQLTSAGYTFWQRHQQD